MSTTPNDGGPAFPIGQTDRLGGFGMSLRDYFAGQAMQAMVSAFRQTLPVRHDDPADTHGYTTFGRDLAIDQNGVTGCFEGADEIAADAYIIADAMLKARESKGGAA